MKVFWPNAHMRNQIVSVADSLINKLQLNRLTNGYLSNLRSSIVNEHISNAIDKKKIDSYIIPLNKIALIQSGYSYKSSELVDESKIGMISIKNFERDGTFKSNGFKPILPMRVKSSQYVKLGEIVVAHTDLTQNADIIGRAIQVIDDGGYDSMIESLDLVKVSTFDESISNEFLSALLCTEDFHRHCLRYINGTTVLHLSKKALHEYVLKIPKDESLLKQLEILFKHISSLQSVLLRENRQLGQLRDLLLPKLMSGEIDVSKITLPTQPNNHLHKSELCLQNGLIDPLRKDLRWRLKSTLFSPRCSPFSTASSLDASRKLSISPCPLVPMKGQICYIYSWWPRKWRDAHRRQSNTMRAPLIA